MIIYASDNSSESSFSIESSSELEPMNSADRKIVHDALVEAEGISTRSEGTDPFRRVVVALASTFESSLDDSTQNEDSDELSEA